MSLDAIKAVVDLIEMGAMANQEDIVKCLRSAIEQAERQEPVGWITQAGLEVDRTTLFSGKSIAWRIPVYTAPPQRQPLTEIAEALRRNGLTLVETVKGYDVMRLGEITAQGVGGEHD